ncbi:hypothetical protein DFS34DRAFT_200301 [Phlyctochytrium arcticum]|nr:hypothetical protein DFS34DRAFT_200301 [Phlyctochytrium arcticum]
MKPGSDWTLENVQSAGVRKLEPHLASAEFENSVQLARKRVATTKVGVSAYKTHFSTVAAADIVHAVLREESESLEITGDGSDDEEGTRDTLESDAARRVADAPQQPSSKDILEDNNNEDDEMDMPNDTNEDGPLTGSCPRRIDNYHHLAPPPPSSMSAGDSCCPTDSLYIAQLRREGDGLASKLDILDRVRSPSKLHEYKVVYTGYVERLGPDQKLFHRRGIFFLAE